MKRRHFLLLGPLCLLGIRQAAAQFDLTPSRLDCLARQLFRRECGGQKAYLVWWSPDEAFPSLGVGHFIWLPKGVSVPFEQTFPQLVAYLAQSHSVPAWLKARHAPWPNRRAWLADETSGRVEALRAWLWTTRRDQAAFVVDRFNQRWLQACRRQSDGARLQQKLRRLVANDARALWAVLDYSNFKGFGDVLHERYHGKGWGLVQVVRGMENADMKSFVDSAKAVLKQRIDHAPRDERHWWPGWKSRVESYLEAANVCTD